MSFFKKTMGLSSNFLPLCGIFLTRFRPPEKSISSEIAFVSLSNVLHQNPISKKKINLKKFWLCWVIWSKSGSRLEYICSSFSISISFRGHHYMVCVFVTVLTKLQIVNITAPFWIKISPTLYFSFKKSPESKQWCYIWGFLLWYA